MSKSKGFVSVMIIYLLLLLGAIGSLIYLFFVYKELSLITINIFKLVALLSAAFYLFFGCRKVGADYFQWFTIAYGLDMASMLISLPGNSGLAVVLKILTLISFGSLCVLTFAKDLGKKKSNTFAAVIFIASILMLVNQIFVVKLSSITLGGRLSDYIFPIVDLILSMLLGVMIYAKYKDKEARGSK